MSFSATWQTLAEETKVLPEEVTLLTPLSNNRFRITDDQENHIVIELDGSGESRQLQWEQFNGGWNFESQNWVVGVGLV